MGWAAPKFKSIKKIADGLGLASDAFDLYQSYLKFAKDGDMEAQYNLGNAYYFGKGVEKNFVEAAKWYTKAAEQGLAEAQNNLAQCYEKGTGVEKDQELAILWYGKAYDQGLPNAKANLKAMQIRIQKAQPKKSDR